MFASDGTYLKHYRKLDWKFHKPTSSLFEPRHSLSLLSAQSLYYNIFAGACAESSAESSSEWKNSVKEATRNLVTAIKSAPMPPPPPDGVTQNILLAWMQPVS